MGGGGRISATLPVISPPRLLHTRCTSKRRPIWRATQSHLSAIATTPEPLTFSETDLLPGIPKLTLGPFSSSKPAARPLSALKTYPSCWKPLDFCQSHLPMRRETCGRPAESRASLFLMPPPLTSRSPRFGFWPQQPTRPGTPLSIQVRSVRTAWGRASAPSCPGRCRKRAGRFLAAQVSRRNTGPSTPTDKPVGGTSPRTLSRTWPTSNPGRNVGDIDSTTQSCWKRLFWW